MRILNLLPRAGDRYWHPGIQCWYRIEEALRDSIAMFWVRNEANDGLSIMTVAYINRHMERVTFTEHPSDTDPTAIE